MKRSSGCFLKELASGLVAVLLSGCGERASDLVIEEGACCGLKIGQTQVEVAMALQAKGVKIVNPVEADNLYVDRSTASRLPQLKTARGICAGDNQKLSVNVRFDSADRVDDLFVSPAADGNSLGVELGQSKEVVLARLQTALAQHRGLKISSCLPRVRAISLADVTASKEQLESFDAWFYTEPDSFSYAKVVFGNGTLKRIEYHYRPHETP